MIYLRNTTESQKIFIERQSIQTADTREINYITSGDVINIVDAKLEPYSTTEEVEGMISSAISGTVTEEQMNQAIQSAKTEIEAEIPSLDGYATEEWVQEQGYLTEHQSLSAYSTTEQVEGMISSATSGMATEEWVQEQGYLTEHQSLSAYSTTEQMNTAIDNAVSGKQDTLISGTNIKTINGESILGEGNVEVITDLSDYWTSAETNSAIEEAIASESARCESTYLKEHQSLSAYSTTEQMNEAIATAKGEVEAEIPDVSEFVTSADVETQIVNKNYVTSADVKTQVEEYEYVNSGDVKSQIEGYNYITSADAETQINTKLEDYYTSADTDTKIEEAIATESARCETTYLKEHQSLSAYSTTEQMNTAIDSAVGAESARTDTAINTALEGYYTSAQTDNLLTEKQETLVSGTNIKTINNQSILGSGNIDIQGGGGSYSAGTNIDITDNVISVTGITIPDVSEFVTSADVKTQIEEYDYITSADSETQINEKLVNYYTSAQTDNLLTGKQETLVSGTNIKTINNQSLLGSGNIDIQGGGGSANIIELTQAEYNALTSYTEDAIYVITDAETVDLNDYATSADVQTISGNVETALSGKADKVTVTENSGRRFPAWNTQGIITGTTGSTAYERSLSINGTSKTMLQTTNSDFTGIYAPTSAGSAGQPLLSAGSGAPTWATFKFWYGTQSQYDAITTKDNNTIYFVKDD